MTCHQPERYGYLVIDQGDVLIMDQNEPCVYNKVSGSMIIILILYVDDILLKSGYVFCLNGGVVSLKSSKHDIVVDSTTKFECIVALGATKEVF